MPPDTRHPALAIGKGDGPARGDDDPPPETKRTGPIGSLFPLLLRKWRELSPGLFARRLVYYGHHYVTWFIRSLWFYPYFHMVTLFMQIVTARRYTVYGKPLPARRYDIWKCLKLTGVRLINQPHGVVSIAVAHFDVTNVDVGQLAILKQMLDPATFIINGNVHSNSKDVVETKFEEVFGYNLAIDPLKHVGVAATKSKKNFSRDGRAIECPLLASEIDHDRVYELLIDNYWDQDTTMDYRVPVIGDEIPYVKLIWRSLDRQFLQRSGKRQKVSETDEIFSREEQERILALCRAMGVDFGKLDVLRSQSTNRIYVVDVNHTPSQARGGMTWRGVRLNHREAATFRRQFLEGRYSRIAGR